MTFFAIALVFVGILLSAFFSGTETGFFRSSRVRWVLDGIEGDRVSRYLLRLANDPSLWVGTSLLGSNLASYLISLAVVMLAQGVSDSQSLEMIAPMVLTPVVFVYGDLLPKSLFYQAPNRLLRKFGALYLIFFVLFSPILVLLWALGRLVERVFGQSPEKVRLILARKELDQVLQEGQEAGLLEPIQRRMGQNFFLVAARPVGQLCLPLHRVHVVQRGTTHRQALAHAQRFQLSTVVVYGERRTDLVGYVHTIDLILAGDPNGVIDNVRPFLTLKSQEHAGEALMRMQTQRADLAQIVNDRGQPLGIISRDELTRPLLIAPNH